MTTRDGNSPVSPIGRIVLPQAAVALFSVSEPRLSPTIGADAGTKRSAPVGFRMTGRSGSVRPPLLLNSSIQIGARFIIRRVNRSISLVSLAASRGLRLEGGTSSAKHHSVSLKDYWRRCISSVKLIDHVAVGSFSTEAAGSAARRTSASPRKLTSGPNQKLVASGDRRHRKFRVFRSHRE